jgi:hypothetical protein
MRKLTGLSNSRLGVYLLERSERLQLEKLAEFIERRKTPLATLIDAKHFDSLESDRSVTSTKGSRCNVGGGRENVDQISVPENTVYPLQSAKGPCLGLLLRRMFIEPCL